MVRNEEHVLEEALNSVLPLADQIVVVDTGSTDGTMDIARRYGAELWEHAWFDDFAGMRNRTLQYAVGDWCLILDADERLVMHHDITVQEFKQWLATIDKDINALGIQVTDIQDRREVMTCNSARIFRRGRVLYKNRVHNTPVFSGPILLCGELRISHVGYDLAPEKMEAKFQRTRDLLLRQLEEDPGDCKPYFYLCQLYGMHGSQGDKEESARWGEKYLACREELGSDFNKTIYFTMISNCHQRNDRRRALELIKEALNELPGDPDISFALSNHGAMTGNMPMMAEGCRRYIAARRDFIQNPANKGGRFYFSLRDDVVTLQLYRLFSANIKEGMETWEWLKPRLLTAPAGMVEELNKNLALLGLKDLFPEAEPAKRPASSSALSDVWDDRLQQNLTPPNQNHQGESCRLNS